jgi:hypothetical protein
VKLPGGSVVIWRGVNTIPQLLIAMLNFSNLKKNEFSQNILSAF